VKRASGSGLNWNEFVNEKKTGQRTIECGLRKGRKRFTARSGLRKVPERTTDAQKTVLKNREKLCQALQKKTRKSLVNLRSRKGEKTRQGTMTNRRKIECEWQIRLPNKKGRKRAKNQSLGVAVAGRTAKENWTCRSPTKGKRKKSHKMIERRRIRSLEKSVVKKTKHKMKVQYQGARKRRPDTLQV